MGIQLEHYSLWIPAFAGMTNLFSKIYYMIKPKIFEQFPNVISGFSTLEVYSERLKNMDMRERKNVNEARLELIDKMWWKSDYLFLNQIHTDIVLKIDDVKLKGADADGMRTDKIDLWLSVHVADCVPLLVYVDEIKPMIAVLHSGWRSTQKNIVGKLFEKLKEKWVEMENVYVFVGPSICKECYEFGDEVFDLFDKKYVVVQEDKKYLDTAGVVYDQLLEQWVEKSKIEKYMACTMCDDWYFSYRKSWATNRLMFGFIGLR